MREGNACHRISIESLEIALHRIEGIPKEAPSLICHLARGYRYVGFSYVAMLKEYGIQVGMTGKGDSKGNAQTECINNTMKNELFKDMIFHDINVVRIAVSTAVKFYNED